jgi:phosphoribosylglycinamide formyltransferase-1
MRTLVLIGSSLPNLNTLARFIDSDLNVIGGVIANQKKGGINWTYLGKILRKNGTYKVCSQIMARVIYRVFNARLDKVERNRLFNERMIDKSIESFKKNLLYTKHYHDKATLEWIKDLAPDLIVIHTPYWVSKQVRDIVKGNVIGAHPGLTQRYRGSHSPFWAIYKNDWDNVGYTIFWVSNGIDTGDIIDQGKIKPIQGDSFISLSWKAMIISADRMVQILTDIDELRDIESTKYRNDVDNSLYGHPTLIEYIKYRRSSVIR